MINEKDINDAMIGKKKLSEKELKEYIKGKIMFPELNNLSCEFAKSLIDMRSKIGKNNEKNLIQFSKEVTECLVTILHVVYGQELAVFESVNIVSVLAQTHLRIKHLEGNTSVYSQLKELETNKERLKPNYLG